MSNKKNRLKMTQIFVNLFHYGILTIASLLVATAIELFLAPNGLVDGGVTGLAIMGEESIGVPLEVIFFGLNMPILLFTSRLLGRKFLFRSTYSLLVTLYFLSNYPIHSAITDSDILIVLYGGILLGLGIGLVIRLGGAIDGVEMIAVWLQEKYRMDVSTTIFTANIFVFGLSIFVFDLESAMLSIVVFYTVMKVIDAVEDGFHQHKSLMIISRKHEEISKALIQDMHLSITVLNGRGGYSGQEQVVLYSIVNKFLYSKARDLIMSIDEDAIIEASFVSEANGMKQHEIKERLTKKWHSRNAS